MIIVFDLDDTLYEEAEYVKSGFQAVSDFACSEWKLSSQLVLNDLTRFFKDNGRGQIFDDMLRKNNIYSKANVKKCISVYRLHNPNIKLYPDADQCLDRLRDYPIYIVTDGNKDVQHRKILALNLEKRVKQVMITYRYGIKNSKPSPYCFLKIAKKEGVSANQVLYVGDNPKKDFVGIKPLGFKTIRLRKGEHEETFISPDHEAGCDIKSLDELTPELIKELEKDA